MVDPTNNLNPSYSMIGQAATLTRKESIAHQKAVECGPNKTKSGGGGGNKTPEMKKK